MSSQDLKDRAAIADLSLPGLDDQAGPAAPLSSEAQQALVGAALSAAFPPPAAPSAPTAASPRLWGRRGVLLGGVAAVVGTGAALWLRSVRTPGAKAVRGGAAPAELAPLPPAASPAEQAPLPSAGGGAERPAPAAESPLPAPAKEPVGSARPSVARKVGEVSDLLQRANERRRQQRFAEAVALYQQVLSRDPRSDAAYVARVSAGMLYVERLREPERALRLFLAALKQQPRGALSEEARLGLADAYRALGSTAQERAALTSFLQHHPQSLARAQAERRLRSMEAR
jgi:tetratricopeptide (TPR) repeat protein